MSTTATGIDLKKILIDNIQAVGSMYATDFGFLPKDKLGASPMGKARNPIEFTAECAGFNLFVAGLVRGQTITRTDEERAAYYASLDTGDKAIQALNESVLALTGAL